MIFMRIPIFQLDSKNNYREEYSKIMKVLSSKCVTYENQVYTYFDFVNQFLFHHWKYRGTYLDFYSYLEFVGVSFRHYKITEEAFLNFLEVLLNLQLLMESIKKYKSVCFSVDCQSVLFHNIPLIIEKMGYQAYDLDDKVYLFPRNIDYEDLLDLVSDEIYPLLLSYNTIDNNGIKMKRIILHKIYLYLVEHIDQYKSYSSSLFHTIKIVVTKMGVIGEVDKKYQHLSRYMLRKYYDYCFQMMCYLMKTERIYQYRDEIKAE